MQITTRECISFQYFRVSAVYAEFLQKHFRLCYWFQEKSEIFVFRWCIKISVCFCFSVICIFVFELVPVHLRIKYFKMTKLHWNATVTSVANFMHLETFDVSCTGNC